MVISKMWQIKYVPLVMKTVSPVQLMLQIVHTVNQVDSDNQDLQDVILHVKVGNMEILSQRYALMSLQFISKHP